MKKFFRAIGYSLAFLLFFLVLLASFTQTKLFKDRLRLFLVSLITDQIEAHASLGAIGGNFLTGFTIDSLALRVGDQTIISTEKISVAYDLWDIVKTRRDRISIEKVVVERPRIHLERDRHGWWNTSGLSPPANNRSELPTPSPRPTVNLLVEEIRVKDGSFKLRDAAALEASTHVRSLPHQVEYHDIDVFNIDFALSAQIGKDGVRVGVREFSFDSESPPFQLQQLEGEFFVSPSGAEASNVVIVTSNSHISMSARLGNVDLFAGLALEDLRDKPIALSFLADKIDLNELKSFIAPIDFLDGVAFVRVQAGGEFGDMEIEELTVQTYETSLHLRGGLRNLHRPRDLYIVADIVNSTILPSNAHQLLPPFGIPPFSDVGNMEMTAQFMGKPTHFKTSLSLAGKTGSIKIDGTLNLESRPVEYDGSFVLRNFKLEPLLGKSLLDGAVTARGQMKGSGTTLRSVKAAAAIFVDSATVAGVPIANSEVRLTADNGAFEYVTTLRSHEMSIGGAGRIDVSDPDTTALLAHLAFSQIDLARVLHDPGRRTNLTFNTEIDVHARTIDDLIGSVQVELLPSWINNASLDTGRFTVVVDKVGEHERKVSCETPLVDAEFEGAFTFRAVVERLRSEFQLLREEIYRRVDPSGSDTPVATRRDTQLASRASTAPFDITYELMVKDLQPLSAYVGGPPFDMRATIRGRIEASSDEFTISAHTAVPEFVVGTLDKGALVEDGVLTVAYTARDSHAGGMPPFNAPRENILDLAAAARFAMLNRITFDSTSVRIALRNLDGIFEVRTHPDSLVQLSTTGIVETSYRTSHLSLSDLVLRFGEFEWKNETPVELDIDQFGIHLRRFTLARDDERISVIGSLGHDGGVQGQLTIQGLDLLGLGYYTGSRELKRAGQRFSGAVNVSAELQGSVGDPRFHIVTTGSSLRYRDQSIGDLDATLRYENENLHVDLVVERREDAADRMPDFTVTGNIPLNLAFQTAEDRILEREMRLDILSGGFQLGALTPLLTGFDALRGTLLCSLHVAGTPSNPNYSGWVNVVDTRFRFVLNNLFYNVSGQLHAQGDRIELINVRVSNDQRDRSDATVFVSGYATLKRFAVEEFDLRANGQLVLMTEASRHVIPAFYGTLFASTGPGGLTYRGTWRDSRLSGDLYIRDADLTFPPSRDQVYVLGETALIYVEIDDTSNITSDDRLAGRFFSPETTNNRGAHSDAAPSRLGGTMWDGLSYDIRIETRGTTQIRMIFNPATNEELFAELDGRVAVQRGETGPRVTGNITVSERSYYNFFKRFSARGELRFLGPPDNPELDITAVYEDSYRSLTAELDTVQQVAVTLRITGTRYEPHLAIGMTVDGQDRAAMIGAADVESDAIAFLLTGKFRDDLTSRERSDIVSNVTATAGSSILFGLPSQMLSGALTNFLRKEFPFIRSAELTYRGGGLQEAADLRITGEVFRGYWRFGGKIFNDIGNANISIVFPMGEVLESTRLRNLYVELERKVEGGETAEHRRLTNAARIYYKVSF